MNIKMLKVALIGLLLSVSSFANAGLMFDNGTTIDQTNTTWNMTSPNWTIYEDFFLTNDSIITNINYSIFATSLASYQQSFISILDGFSGNIIVALFSSTGAVSANGLVSNNGAVPLGFNIALIGLNINLSSGNYVLGLSTDCSLCSVANGDSGFGSSLYQNTTLRQGDHMAFQIEGSAEGIPEPSTLAIFALGILGLASRRIKKHYSFI